MALAVLLLAAAGCRSDSAAGPPPPPPPAQVGVLTIKAETVRLSRELPGRTSAFRVAEVRARVNGIVLERSFTEGSDVNEGQVLFRIDAAPYQAALDSANAQLARAQAMVESAQVLVDRYKELVALNGISKQENDDAVARLRTAQADVAAARAAVKTARIQVDFSTVRAPVSGRIGRAEVTEGAYVQQSAATLLATIQQLDPMYVDMNWSSIEALRLRRALARGDLTAEDGQGKVTVLLEDGSEHSSPGTLQFADVTVDPSSGSITLRALFPNPKSLLLPGMFVRARIEEGVMADALLVPQRAVTRDRSGAPFALIVTADNKVERRELTTDRTHGAAWLVTAGIAAGDRVVVEGLQKTKPGATVAPVPWSPSATTPSTPALVAPPGTAPATDATTPPGAARPAPAPSAPEAGVRSPPTPPASSTKPAAP